MIIIDNVQLYVYVVRIFHKDSRDHYIYCQSSTIYSQDCGMMSMYVIILTSQAQNILFPSQNIAKYKESLFLFTSV